jgi:hypothetical protein
MIIRYRRCSNDDWATAFRLNNNWNIVVTRFQKHTKALLYNDSESTLCLLRIRMEKCTYILLRAMIEIVCSPALVKRQLYNRFLILWNLLRVQQLALMRMHQRFCLGVHTLGQLQARRDVSFPLLLQFTIHPHYQACRGCKQSHSYYQPRTYHEHP